MKRKHKIVHLHEGDDLVVYVKGTRPIKLIKPRWIEFKVEYEPYPSGHVRLECLDIKQYKVRQ